MNKDEFYDYIVENFNLDGASFRLVHNIIYYVANQEFTDVQDAQVHLKSLLDGAFGIEEHEIRKYRQNEVM